MLLPYVAYTVGTGRDDTGPFMALALVHSDAQSADENKQRLERRISENEDLQAWLEGMQESILSVEGRVLSAKIRGDRPASAWKGLAFTITPLIPHE